VALDAPGAIVALDEAGRGLAELIDGVIQGGPQALLLEGADPALGTAACLRLAQERRAVGDPQPRQGPGEMGRAVLGSPIVP
jgi:hypothetical protein